MRGWPGFDVSARRKETDAPDVNIKLVPASENYFLFFFSFFESTYILRASKRILQIHIGCRFGYFFPDEMSASVRSGNSRTHSTSTALWLYRDFFEQSHR